MKHWEEMAFFAIIFFCIFGFWLATGGVQRATSSEGMYLNPPVTAGYTGTVYGGTAFEHGITGTTTITFPNGTIHFPSGFGGGKATIPNGVPHSNLYGEISFDGVAGAKNNTANTEYFRLLTANDLPAPINITGFFLGSFASGNLATITNAVVLPILGSIYSEQPLIVSSSTSIIVTTGPSPIGTSFAENKCSGFLNQLYSFTPAILKLCPSASALLTRAGLTSDASCTAYVKTIPQCTAIASSAVPANLSASCKTFISQTLTYNGCVASTQNDSDFYSNQWRVFLGKGSEFWNNTTDAIGFFDLKGGLVSGLTY